MTPKPPTSAAATAPPPGASTSTAPSRARSTTTTAAPTSPSVCPSSTTPSATGTGHEVGLKFKSRDGRFSGSVQAYTTDSKDEMTNDGTVAPGLKNRTYFYNTPGGGRELFSAPDSWQVNAIVSYRRKLGRRFGWTTQVNIENIFNHYVLGTLPNNGSGFTNPSNLAVAFYGQPRMYVWTNSLSF